jgi:glycosyltransferase involved in cell wall biosynthesis
MNSNLKISVVTPSYNQGAFLEETLLSVKEQGYPALEHIVIDGGSTDRSVEILKKYSSQPGWGHLHWVSGPDGGQSDALNKGFKLATGDIIGWLNSDDRYRSGCFEKIASSVAQYPEADVFYGDSTFMNEKGHVWRIRREIEFNRFILHHLYMLYILTAATFFRRRVFQDGNWIDTKYSYAMDYEFILRLDDKGYRFRHVPELLADFRIHPQSKSISQPKRTREEHNLIGVMYSPVLRSMRGTFSRKLVLNGLRFIARGLRYSEKLLRGYYLEQFGPPTSTIIRSRGRQ